ncbi:MAG: GMC family oxidoreductase N-terminal domain-containing protein [Ahrensia sp.]|nr:GMC family oxidoreductase N-terminal domain-containing protein [Ahrensia sp.]
MEFDYVIVGAGSAGCALASRLSESGRYSVALIEAGGRDSSPWIHIPVGYFKTMNHPQIDWRYKTQPDPGLNGRSLNWPRGRVLGGSSSINGLLYVRGQREDYDHWRQLGNRGWGWDDIAPCFKRSENWEGGESDLRGGAGPLSVSKTRLQRTSIDRYVEAAQQAGFAYNDDYNGATQEGVGYFQLTAKDGRRCSSAVAYLKPARSRPNLSIFTGYQTRKLEMSDGRATGVVARGRNGDTQFTARKEIVLCAGAIGSPQILMLSGIGPGQDLTQHGIESKVDLPGVGRNLQDHLQARPVFKCKSSTINTETNSWFKQVKIGIEYALRRTGPMTMAASLGTGFLKTRPELATPDIQFHLQPFSTEKVGTATHGFDAFTASVLQLRPESTGHLTLRSSDIEDHPIIHPNYLSTPLDCQTIVDGIRIARRIARHEPARSEIIEEHAPGEAIADEDFDGLLDWARNTSTTIYHPTGTCKMGSDPMAVVDDRLKVRGVEGLRVADASIMPTIVSGNTNAPCIMIGERVSDFILEDAA